MVLPGSLDGATPEEARLAGVCVAITRPAAQSAELIALLRQRGAEVLLAPVISPQPVSPNSALRQALDSWESYDWVLLTSANAVRMLGEEFPSLFSTRRGPSLAVVGQATRRTLTELGGEADLVPPAEHGTQTGQGLAAALLAREPDLTGKRILFPKAAGAAPELPALLREAGASLTEVTLYRTVAVPLPAEVAERLLLQPPHYVTFTSGSTVGAFTAALSEAGLAPERWFSPGGSVVAASIGPVTSAALREAGFSVPVEAEVPDMPSLVSAIQTDWSKRHGRRQR